MTKRVAATTVGCKVNLYDTQAVLQRFVEQGYEVADFASDADVYIVNTCSVTNIADKKSRQMIRRAKSRGGIVVAMGCAVQADGVRFAEIGVDIVVGTAERGRIVDFVERFIQDSVKIEHIVDISAETDFEDAFVEQIDGRTRAFLKIQDGCDNFCAYCIVPHVRGRPRSRPVADVLAQARHFADAGRKEIVVAGIHVASYGKDLGEGNGALLAMLKEICGLSGVERVRLSSVEPGVITPDFLDFAAANPKFCDHLHLSLQSGSDRILKLMNRKYTTGEYANAVEKLRMTMPEISITTDIIAGFPGETDDDHKQTMAFVEDLGLCGLHVFPFAAKAGTAAADMPGQLAGNIKQSRAAELVALGKRLTDVRYAGYVGKTVAVLVEERKAGLFVGKTTNYLSVGFESDRDLTNTIVGMKIESQRGDMLFGQPGVVICG
ncbi:MAG: tRNA (N(6)-L-threonylcarbamoyladenosine(37)-C(2))-methylthiotransferase MtaB [Defluviitaleaceae bacterium]|nr:tRNA (N(6)-L-threonylcarbamoyladenosine(37)-C(2))-methylthiotransferase MtaB [Defluviitaleaceae bacterium]